MTSKLDKPEILNSIFFPRKENISPLPQAAVDLEIVVSGKATVLGCRLHVSDKSAPLIIYFHGNGETVADYDTIAESYTSEGLNLFVTTYRGYGWSTGEPTVTTLYSDAELILEFIRKYIQDNDFTGPLFVMGRSLGSVSALDLVLNNPDLFKGLILESAFAETLPLASRLGFDITDKDITEEDCFDNLNKIKKITMPTMILHGARDQLIPVSEAEKLQAESGARTKQFHVIPGADHNSLIANGGRLYFETIKKFTDTVTGKNTWRRRRKKFRKSSDQ